MLSNLIGGEGADRDFHNGFDLRSKRQKNNEDSFLSYYRLFDEILNTPKSNIKLRFYSPK